MEQSDVLVTIVLLCFAVHSGSGDFKVAMIPPEDIECFERMGGKDPICSSNNSTELCDIHYKNNMICLKWQADIDLDCLNIDFKKITYEEKPARDQQSISCSNEFKSDSATTVPMSVDSASSMTMSISLVTACVVMVMLIH